MATPEQVWQSFLVEIQERYDEPFSELIPTDTRGKSAREGAQARVTKAFTKRALDEIRRRQAADWTDESIVETLVRNVSNNVERSGGVGAGGPFAWGLTPTNYTLTFEQSSDTDDQVGILFEGLFTERVAADPVDTAFPDPDASLAPVAGRNTTLGSRGDNETLLDQAWRIAGDEGTVVGTKYDNVFKVIARTRDQFDELQEDESVSGFYQVNDNGELGWAGSRLSDIDADEVTKYTHDFDLDGKQYRINNATGDIEVKETLSGQFGFPGQGVWRSGTIRVVEGPEDKPKRWGTYTDETGTWQYDLDDPQGQRFKISEAQQNIGTVTRFNDDTQQYETFRVDLDTGLQVGDSLGQGFDVFESNRNFQLDSDRLGESTRQFNVTDARLRDEFNRTFGENVRQFDKRFGEDVRQFDTRFGEDVRQFNLGFGETQRQFDTAEDRMERTLAANNYFNSLEELGRNYRTFVQTAPQMANAATQQGQLVSDILRSGGDVLARTYFTRGGMSPLPEITQADLINNLNDEMTKIQRFEQQGIQAENARRARADMERARGEYEQFAELQRQTPQFTTRQIFDDTGFGAAQTEFQQSLGDMQNEAAAAAQAHSEHANSFQAVSQQAADAARAAGADAAGIGLAVEAAQTQWQNQLDALAATVNQYDAQLTGPTRAQFTETIREQVPIPDFQTWAATQGPSFAPTPLLNVPNVPTPRRTTQEELIAQSRATTPPAVASVLSGQMPTPLQFGGLPLPTFQQLQALTPTEQQMLNTRLMTEFNVPLEDVAFQSQRQFSTPSMERNRDLARFRGYAV
jgi:hypothetical protein